MKPSQIAQRLEQFESVCRERGVPLTVQRRDILQTILERDDHPSAEQVYEAVKTHIPGLSRTTVYRALDTLADLGVIRRLHHPGTGARFGGNLQRHHHLVCRKCWCVIDIESAGLDGLRLSAAERHGFEIEDYSVHFTGLCQECFRQRSK